MDAVCSAAAGVWNMSLLTQWQTCLVVQSPGVELVEPDAVLVKEEKVEANMSRVEETEEDVPLIGDDGEQGQRIYILYY